MMTIVVSDRTKNYYRLTTFPAKKYKNHFVPSCLSGKKIMHERITEKLSILADAAKYDVSCASSGSNRKNDNKGLGDSKGMGICHAYTEDGRCVSLLKILLTNHCIYDCAY